MSLTIEKGTPIVEDPQRLADVDAVGVDETAYLRATGRHPTWFATGITDLTPGRPARLLDVVEGRSGPVLGDWLAARDPDWRARINTASLDPFRGYATALATQLPDATRVLDPFHVGKLACAASMTSVAASSTTSPDTAAVPATRCMASAACCAAAATGSRPRPAPGSTPA